MKAKEFIDGIQHFFLPVIFVKRFTKNYIENKVVNFRCDRCVSLEIWGQDLGGGGFLYFLTVDYFRIKLLVRFWNFGIWLREASHALKNCLWICSQIWPEIYKWGSWIVVLYEPAVCKVDLASQLHFSWRDYQNPNTCENIGHSSFSSEEIKLPILACLPPV